MVFASVLGIILGLIMLLYPGGTMALIQAAFWAFQAIISLIFLFYAVTEAVRYFKMGNTSSGVGYLIIGILAAVLVWLFDVGIIYIIAALFFIVSGIGEAVLGARMMIGRYFLILLGIINVFVGVVMLKYPVILPLLIAWYILFWGVSRLLLAFEFKRPAS
jgi:uncharacterized membrane protein HdeD (DUF308 family)